MEADGNYFGGCRRGKRDSGAEKMPVFGIIEQEGRVRVEVLSHVKVETLLQEISKKVKQGSIIPTGIRHMIRL